MYECVSVQDNQRARKKSVEIDSRAIADFYWKCDKFGKRKKGKTFRMDNLFNPVVGG